MRILLLQPPVRDFYFTPHRASALGLEVLAVCCRALGEEAMVINFSVKGKKPAILDFPRELRHLDPYIIPGEKGPLSFFSSFKRFGPDFEACAAAAASLNPDTVWISCFAFAYADDAVLLADAVKKLLPEIFVCLGGAGVSVWPEYCLTRSRADAVVTGEGERAAAPLIAALRKKTGDFSGVPGMLWKEDGVIRSSGVRAPAGETDMAFTYSAAAFKKGRAILSTSLTRGCPRSCRFCSVRLSQGEEYRMLPVSKIAASLKELDLPGDTIINFEDDNLLFDWDYFREVLALFRRVFPGTSFLAENGLDYTLLNPEKIEVLAEAGFLQCNISLGTLSDSGRIHERRAGDSAAYERVMRSLAENNLPSITYFIAGLESDTPESVAESLLYLSSFDTRAGLSMYYAVPGLDGVDEPALRKLVTGAGSHLTAGSSAYPWQGSLGTGPLLTAFRLSRLVNFRKEAEAGLVRRREYLELLKLVLKRKKLYTLLKGKNGFSPVPVEAADGGMEKYFFKRFIY